jgi:hypothetical protein
MTRSRASRWPFLPRAAVGADELGGLEIFDADQRLVGDDVGPDPGVRVVPAHLGLVSEGDLVDVEQDFFLALLVPDLAAGVAGVGKDRADRGLGPAFPAAVPVAGRVVLRG